MSEPITKGTNMTEPTLRDDLFVNVGYGLRAWVLNVAPEMASAFMQHNKANRPLCEKVVERYVAHMLANLWRGPTGQPIIFDSRGDLRNGQHVLSAIIRSGKPQLILAVTGIDPEVFDVLDTGKRRSGADALSVKGFKNTAQLAAACVASLRFRYSDFPLTIPHLSPHETLMFAADHPSLARAVTECPYGVFRLVPSGMAIALYDWALSLSAADAARFFGALATGEAIASEDPVYWLRERLLQARSSKINKLTITYKAAIVIQAWNLTRRERPGSPSSARWHTETPFPRME